MQLKSKHLCVFHGLAHTLPPDKDCKLLVRTPAPGVCQEQAKPEQKSSLAGLIHPGDGSAARGSCCCCDSAFWLISFIMEIWAFGMVSPTQSLWSICWAEAAAETQEGRAPACPGLPAGFVPSALGAEQCKSGSPVPVSHREGTSSSILRAGRAFVSQEFLSTDISTSDAKKSPHPLQNASVRQHSWIFQVLRKRKSSLPPNRIKCCHKLWQFLYDTRLQKGEAEM